jgi:hypothetical protein
MPSDEVFNPDMEKASEILPIAFALATAQHSRCVPMAIFDTALLPMTDLDSYHHPETLMPVQPQPAPSDEELRVAEDWMRRLDAHKSNTLHIAQKRLVSAIAQRTDKADSVIDAVMAWESMVGTRNETVFRVTAALARLLEQEYPARAELRARLNKLYDIRSRLVHGSSQVKPDSISSASAEAIDIGLRAMRALYERPEEWLTMESEARANRLILEN